MRLTGHSGLYTASGNVKSIGDVENGNAVIDAAPIPGALV